MSWNIWLKFSPFLSVINLSSILVWISCIVSMVRRSRQFRTFLMLCTRILCIDSKCIHFSILFLTLTAYLTKTPDLTSMSIKKKHSRWNVGSWSILWNSFPVIRCKRDNWNDDQQQCQGTRLAGEESRSQPHRTFVGLVEAKNTCWSGSTHGTRSASWRHSDVGERSFKLHSEVHCIYESVMPGCYSRGRKYNVIIVEIRDLHHCIWFLNLGWTFGFYILDKKYK